MTDAAPAVARVRRVILVVADLEGMERFFAEAFAFETVERLRDDPALCVLLGLPHVRARQTIMRLGAQEIGLLAFDPPGRPYPTGSTATDLWFQHFAIIVSDMDAAYRRLQAVGRFSAISEGGPQVLPPSSGSVAAYKFRDVEGHPLELLAFPAGAPAYWRDKAGALFLGIDHSAIAVADVARSLAFYAGCLGLAPGARSENQGAAQGRLAGVADAAVTVVGLNPLRAPTPHVELLGYKIGSRRPAPPERRSDDAAASLFVMETAALAPMVEALTAAKTRFISPGIVTLAGGEQAVAVLDPDGHAIIIMQ